MRLIPSLESEDEAELEEILSGGNTLLNAGFLQLMLSNSVEEANGKVESQSEEEQSGTSSQVT